MFPPFCPIAVVLMVFVPACSEVVRLTVFHFDQLPVGGKEKLPLTVIPFTLIASGRSVRAPLA